MGGRHRLRRPSAWLRAARAAAVTAAAATLGAALAIVRRDLVLPPELPPMDMAIVETTGEIPGLPVEAPASAARAASAAATTTPPPPTTTTVRPSPVPRSQTPARAEARVEAALPGDASRGERIVATARTYFGIPYVWGGTNRAGLDCSGLVYLVLRAHGLTPPRTAATLARWSTPISAAEARPGDLVFENRPATHVGIYIGNGRMIDAATFGTVVGERAVRSGMYYGRVT